MAKVIRAKVKARDLPNPNRGQAGNFSEIEVPGDYEVRLEKVTDYEKNTEGWLFEYSCETPSGGSVPFQVYIPYNQLWKITQHFDALGDPVEEDETRDFNPDTLIGRMCAAHIDFPRDAVGQPTSKYREIRTVWPLPQDDEIQELADADTPEVTETSVPEVVDLPDEVETL